MNTPQKILSEGTLPDTTRGVLNPEVTALVVLLRGKLPELLADRPVMLAYLYGSMAAGFASSFSDIDIGLLVDDGLDPSGRFTLIRHLTLAISDFLDNPNVDVRIINDAPIIFRGRVVTDGILLFASNEVERADYEIQTRQQYYDYLPIHRQLQDAFFADIRQRGLSG